ncbi:MAG: acetyltransferase [Saprospiraceae bacterium]|nr:acetyltransferase [Saprospiraceae bacterium]
MNNFIAIIGYSGHAYVVCDILLKNKVNIKGYCERTKKENNPYLLDYLGLEMEYSFDDEDVFIAIGDNKIRKNVFDSLAGKASFGDAYHPTAEIGYGVQLGSMIMLGGHSIVNPLAILGNGVIINTGAIVEHECTIGDFVHVAPGAVLAGNVTVGDQTFIGAGAVVKQGVKICKDVVIGAGSVVVKDIEVPGTYIGIPARKLL